MHYKHLHAVDRLFKDMIMSYVIHFFTVFNENFHIQLDIEAEQRNIYKSFVRKIIVHHVDNWTFVESIE